MKTERKNSEARLRANAKYDAANTVKYTIKINRKINPEIIAKMDSVPNKQEYLKQLILADIAKNE